MKKNLLLSVVFLTSVMPVASGDNKKVDDKRVDSFIENYGKLLEKTKHQEALDKDSLREVMQKNSIGDIVKHYFSTDESIKEFWTPCAAILYNRFKDQQDCFLEGKQMESTLEKYFSDGVNA